tara:strand:- start:1574 stop:2026 length:453 start_codon:yes stop_codon:yes gene_type:complete
MTVDIELAPSEKGSSFPKGTIVEAIWQEGKNHINIIFEQEGSTDKIGIVAGKGTEQWDEFFGIHTEEEVDKWTADLAKRRQESEKKNKEERERLDDMKALFTAKLQAFEIPEVKESKDRALRSRIRRAKTPVEVTAVCTIIMLNAMNENE